MASDVYSFGALIHRVLKDGQFNVPALKSTAKKCLTPSPGSLKGHCHTDFAVFWSKYTKYMTNYPCSNIKLLLEHQEDNIK